MLITIACIVFATIFGFLVAAFMQAGKIDDLYQRIDQLEQREIAQSFSSKTQTGRGFVAEQSVPQKF